MQPETDHDLHASPFIDNLQTGMQLSIYNSQHFLALQRAVRGDAIYRGCDRQSVMKGRQQDRYQVHSFPQPQPPTLRLTNDNK